VTSTDEQLTLRPPLWGQVWVVVFPIGVAVILLSDVVPLRGDPGGAMRALFCVLAAALGWRLRGRLQRQAAEVRAWVSGRPQPFR
jgi:hypothetical protein